MNQGFYAILNNKILMGYSMNTLADRIVMNPDVVMGKPAIRGLRITVEQILRALAAGVPPEDLLEDYPELEAADLLAVFAFAGELVSEHVFTQLLLNHAP